MKTTKRSFAKASNLLWICLSLLPATLWAQTTTYHLHAALSSTPGQFQLQTAGPGTTSVSFMSGPMAVAGDYQVAGFDTQAGVPGTLGYFPTGSQFTFTVWMQTTIASHGPVHPEAKIYVNTPAQSGGFSSSLLCSAVSSSVLTTTLQPFNLSCTTTTNVGMQTTSRVYLWVGAAQAGIGGPTLRAKLSVEGSNDSQVAVPSAPLVPHIAISPTIGGVNTAVTITGTNLGDGSQSIVTFEGMPATATWNGNGTITAKVPLGTFSGNVMLTVAGVDSNGVYFTDTSPTIFGLTTYSGPPGTQVSLNGSMFGSTQGSSTVTFSDGTTTVPATVVTNGWTNYNFVTVIVPAGPTAGNVSVVITVGGVASNAVSFTLAPTLNSPSPSSGAIGDAIAVTGTGFDPTGGNSTVLFNGTQAATMNWSRSSVTATVPAGLVAGSANITVKVNGITSNSANFTVIPGIVSMSSNAGTPGMEVVLEGTNFGIKPGMVTFGGVRAPLLAWVDGSISVLVPCANTGSVSVIVYRADGLASNPVSFTINLQ